MRIEELELPKAAYVNKFVAKTKFYDRAALSMKIQREFIDKIQKITWKYKLAEETIGTSKTEKVTEIQIFEIELKEQGIPESVLKVIDQSIPYPILYHFVYRDSAMWGMSLKEKNKVEDYYFSGWNEELSLDFSGANLERLYQNLVKVFIGPESKKSEDFYDIIETDRQIKFLEKDVQSLEKKVHSEKQFNRKVEWNKKLLEKKRQLVALREETE